MLSCRRDGKEDYSREDREPEYWQTKNSEDLYGKKCDTLDLY